MTKIEWVKGKDGEQGQTWNPIVGCSLASPGCTNCYAMRMAARLEAMGLEHYRGLTQSSKAGAVWTGKVALAPDSVLLAPLKRKKPTTYFVNSMGDLFHESVPDEWILKVLDVIRVTSWDGGSNAGTMTGRGEHTYQLLTKRADRMRHFMNRLEWDGERLFLKDRVEGRVILRNLWLGVSCEDQRRADERIPYLLATPATIRFVSCEPLLEPVDLTDIPFPPREFVAKPMHEDIRSGTHRTALRQVEGSRLDWIICGGESGSGARQCDLDWIRSLRDQCAAASVPFFFKQYVEKGRKISMPTLDGCEWNEMPGIGAIAEAD